MKKTIYIVIVIVVALALAAILYWISPREAMIGQPGVPADTTPKSAEEVLQSLNGQRATSTAVMSSSTQQAVLKSLSSPSKPPAQTSNKDMENILKSLQN